MIPPVSPVEILAVLLIELLFGLGFNRLVEWAQGNKVWDVSLSVVIGVSVTLAIPTAWWLQRDLAFWQVTGLLVACFGASGLPMIIGSTRRTVRESHKRRTWPTAAAQARDDALMELSALADGIAGKQVGDAQAVNRLHQVIGTLKSV